MGKQICPVHFITRQTNFPAPKKKSAQYRPLHSPFTQINTKTLIQTLIMKLQFALLAATVALAAAKNIQGPSLNKNTERKLKNVGNKAAKKAQDALANYGVKVDLKDMASNMVQAGAPHGNKAQKELSNKFDELATQFGSMSLSDIQKTIASRVNKEIDNAERSSPDGAKAAMDVGQNFLNALLKAGSDAMGKNGDLTLNNLAGSASKAASRAINGKGVHNAIRKANQNI